MADDTVDIRVKLSGARDAAKGAHQVSAEVVGIGKAGDKAAAGTRRATKETERHGKALRLLGRGAAYALGAGGFGGGLYALFAVGRKTVDQYRESQSVMRATQAVLKSTGGAANVTARGVSNLSTALSMKTGIDDEVIQKAENMLLTFRDIRNEQGRGNKIFTRTTRAAADMSAAFEAAGKSMSPTDAALQLGKAVNDPVKGMTRLTRVGVTFTKQQQDQVAALVKSGDRLGAQKVILKELDKEFGGSAKKQATSGKKLSVAVGNLEEAIGKGLAPMFIKAANKVTPFVQGMVDGTGAGGRFVKTLDHLKDTVAPVVTDFAHGAVAVGKFAAAHPDLVKMAAAGVLGYKAFKLLGGVKLAKLVGWILRLRKAGRTAKVAEAIAGNLGTLPAKSSGPLGRFKGYLNGRLGGIGGIGGRVLGGAILTALDAYLATHTPNLSGSPIEKLLFPLAPKQGVPRPDGGRPPKSPGPGWHQERLGSGAIVWVQDRDPGGSHVPRGHPVGRNHGTANSHVPHKPRTRAHPNRRATVPGGGDTVVHAHIHLDGKEVAQSVTRHTNDDRNRR